MIDIKPSDSEYVDYIAVLTEDQEKLQAFLGELNCDTGMFGIYFPLSECTLPLQNLIVSKSDLSVRGRRRSWAKLTSSLVWAQNLRVIDKYAKGLIVSFQFGAPTTRGRVYNAPVR